jgi:hypothetical protein
LPSTSFPQYTDELWVADNTEIAIAAGLRYIAVILDA